MSSSLSGLVSYQTCPLKCRNLSKPYRLLTCVAGHTALELLVLIFFRGPLSLGSVSLILLPPITKNLLQGLCHIHCDVVIILKAFSHLHFCSLLCSLRYWFRARGILSDDQALHRSGHSPLPAPRRSLICL